MVGIWVILGLIIATVCVSTLGAAFSVLGLAALFSGAAKAVVAMSASLEFAKFVLSAYLHQRWTHVNWFFKSYLLFAIVVLSAITSMGIFGFLSSAYQSSSAVLEAENIKLESLKSQQARYSSEIARINKNVEEIPAERITKKLKARAEAEPMIQALTKQGEAVDQQIAQSNLKILEVKDKVGPLIYISRTFKMDIDTVVKYLILVFVMVFDPLAICLVIAVNESLDSRRKGKAMAAAVAAAGPAPLAPESAEQAAVAGEEVIQMNFADEKDSSAV